MFQSTLARERATRSPWPSGSRCFNPRSRASERQPSPATTPCAVSIHARARASDRRRVVRWSTRFQSTLARERATAGRSGRLLRSFNPRSRASERPLDDSPQSDVVSIHARARASDLGADGMAVLEFQSTLARERATAQSRAGDQRVSIHARARASDRHACITSLIVFQSTLARERATSAMRAALLHCLRFNPRSRASERPGSGILHPIVCKFQSTLARERATLASDYYAVEWFQSTLARERATLVESDGSRNGFNPRSRASERPDDVVGELVEVSIHARARASDRPVIFFGLLMFQSTLARERATLTTLLSMIL